MVGTDRLPVPQTGLPQGPLPHIHILPCPYDTWSNRDPEYSRGEGGGDVDGWALVVARPATPIPRFAMYWGWYQRSGPCPRLSPLRPANGLALAPACHPERSEGSRGPSSPVSTPPFN
ncbi:MAG: hypothetical protein ACJ8DI_29985 [Ktedonobacteraceae bacterium]